MDTQAVRAAQAEAELRMQIVGSAVGLGPPRAGELWNMAMVVNDSTVPDCLPLAGRHPTRGIRVGHTWHILQDVGGGTVQEGRGATPRYMQPL